MSTPPVRPRHSRLQFLLEAAPLLPYALRYPNRDAILSLYVQLEMRKPAWMALEGEILNKAARDFDFGGERYRYFYHPYNTTWASERSVEIALVQRALERDGNGSILEVGNVTSHYFPRSSRHTVVDKYEPWPGVIREDIVDYDPGRQFDLVLAISTIEHVGWDERKRDPPKVGRALGRLNTLVAPGGRMFLTVPIGHNPHLDRLLAARDPRFGTLRFLKRTTWDNQWTEADWESVRSSSYGFWKDWLNPSKEVRFPFANAIAVADYRAPTVGHAASERN